MPKSTERLLSAMSNDDDDELFERVAKLELPENASESEIKTHATNKKISTTRKARSAQDADIMLNQVETEVDSNHIKNDSMLGFYGINDLKNKVDDTRRGCRQSIAVSRKVNKFDRLHMDIWVNFKKITNGRQRQIKISEAGFPMFSDNSKLSRQISEFQELGAQLILEFSKPLQKQSRSCGFLCL